MCGFNELRFIEEYELWLTSLQEPAFMAEWRAWADSLATQPLEVAA
jgi:hypothetical protein